MEVAQHIDPQEVKALLEMLQKPDEIKKRAPHSAEREAQQPRPYMPNNLRPNNEQPKPLPFNRSSRRRRKCGTAYEVLDYAADRRHRPNTWTMAMVVAAITNSDTRTAETWLKENFPEYAERSIDWRWLSDDKNYIRFI